MQATVKGRPLVMVLLDSDGKYTRFADAQRVRSWVEHGSTASLASSSKSRHRRSRSRSEEHTSELQSLMRSSYAVFCLKKKNKQTPNTKKPTKSTIRAKTDKEQ